MKSSTSGQEVGGDEKGVHDSSSRQFPDADAEAVEKLGLTATLPRSLSSISSLIGLNTSVVLPWTSTYVYATLNLSNGGTAGLLLGGILSSILMTNVYLSLAEKLRRYPTAGGQYHFVAALAPQRYQRTLSFFCGFLLCFTWLSVVLSTTWSTALLVTAIIAIYTGEYHVKWNFAIAACICGVDLVVNCGWGKWINHLERMVVVIQTVAFLLLVGLLASYVGAKGTPHAALSFTSSTNWSVDVASALSILYTASALVGFDIASHISEDTIDARRQLPRSLLTSMAVGGVSTIVATVLIALSAGEVSQLSTQSLALSGHPLGLIIQLTYNATRGNKALASAVFGLIAPLGISSSINCCAAAARLVYSLIRDDHNPAVQKVMSADLRPGQLPRITICFAALSPLLTLWINFVSSVGFPAIISQVTLSLSTTYIMVICCSLYSRFYHPEVLGAKRKGIFQLGKVWGSINDTVSLCFLIYIWIFAWFPFALPVDSKHLANLNYAPIIDAGVLALGVPYYVLYGRKYYRNPAPKNDVDGSEAGY